MVLTKEIALGIFGEISSKIECQMFLDSAFIFVLNGYQSLPKNEYERNVSTQIFEVVQNSDKQVNVLNVYRGNINNIPGKPYGKFQVIDSRVFRFLV